MRSWFTLFMALLAIACERQPDPECLQLTQTAISEASGAQTWCYSKIKAEPLHQDVATLDECLTRLKGGVALIDAAKGACQGESTATLAEIDGYRSEISDVVRTFELMRGIALGTTSEADLLEETIRQLPESDPE